MLTVNLRHLAEHPLCLRGELPVAYLDLDTRDAMIQPPEGSGLRYDLEVQKVDRDLLVRGRLRLVLRCRCVRCLKPFEYRIALDDWTRHVPLEGEEPVPVVNDCVDLTPSVREDILLEFPQHPVCGPACRGLEQAYVGRTDASSAGAESLSAWAELDKLKL